MIKELLAIGLAGYLGAACAYTSTQSQDQIVGNLRLKVTYNVPADNSARVEKESIFPRMLHNDGKDELSHDGKDYCFWYVYADGDGTYQRLRDFALDTDGSFLLISGLEEKFPCEDFYKTVALPVTSRRMENK